jgi:hypothetical protein
MQNKMSEIRRRLPYYNNVVGERCNRYLTILGWLRDGNGYQYNKSLKIIEFLQYMNNLDIVLALFTTPNHSFSRLDTTAAFQAATSATSN